jgi:hypothetical protein
MHSILIIKLVIKKILFLFILIKIIKLFLLFFKDPITMELDQKIRKVDLDNRRLTAELADLQEKYQSLSSGSY